MKSLTEISPQLEKSFFETVGRITTQMSWIETQLRITLSVVAMRDPEIGLKLTHDIYMKRLIELLKRSMKHFKFEKKVLDKFNSLVAEISEHDAYRNELVHSNWIYNKVKNAMFGSKLIAHKKLGVEIIERTADIDKMNQELDRMEALSTRLFHFTEKLKIILPDAKHERIPKANDKETPNQA